MAWPIEKLLCGEQWVWWRNFRWDDDIHHCLPCQFRAPHQWCLPKPSNLRFAVSPVGGFPLDLHGRFDETQLCPLSTHNSQSWSMPHAITVFIFQREKPRLQQFFLPRWQEDVVHGDAPDFEAPWQTVKCTDWKSWPFLPCEASAEGKNFGCCEEMAKQWLQLWESLKWW